MFGISHQKAGLNRPGKYKECSRERRLLDAWRVLLQHKGTKDRRHEDGERGRHGDAGTRRQGEHAVWTRITGITGAVEDTLTAKERRDGLKRLVERIKEFTTEDTDGNSKSETRNSKHIQNGETENTGTPLRGVAHGADEGTPLRGVAHSTGESANESGDKSPHSKGAKRSRYFRMRPEDYASEERGDERARRIGELVEAMRRGFDMEDWAARVGFASGARLKKACLNVLGRSLRAVEMALAEEVVRYYLCAEDKVLREVASREEETANVIRARWIYGKSELAPTEPFLDEWSKAEELTPDWLEKMKKGFGCVT